jgi:hypothetical protein
MIVNPIFAACDGYTKKLEKLIKSKADVNVANAKGDSPLIIAVRSCQSTRRIKLLIDAGADVNHRNKAGKSAFDVAMLSGDHYHGVVLLEAGTEVGKGKKVFKSIRKCECTSNHPIVIRWCKERRLNHSRVAYCLDDEAVEEHRWRVYSCQKGYFDKHSMRDGCPYARNEYGQLLIMSNTDSWRSFCMVAKYDHIDVNCYPDCYGRTLLHCAVLGGSRKVLREVLKKGPDATAVDNKGLTALMMMLCTQYVWHEKSDGDVEDAFDDTVDEDNEDESDEVDDDGEEEEEAEARDVDVKDDEEDDEDDEEDCDEEDDIVFGDMYGGDGFYDDDCYDDDEDEDGDDEYDDYCSIRGKDPLNVQYGRKDSLIEMLVKYMLAKEAARKAKV